MFSLEQYRAVRDGSGVLDRSARSRLRLTGGDRREYLQGLLTNDIAALTPGSGCYAALLTAQGRTRADVIRILKSTARTPGAGLRGIYTPVYGHGIVDAAAAVAAP